MSVSESAKHHTHYPPHRHVLHQHVLLSISSDHVTCEKNSSYSYHPSTGRNETGGFRNFRV
eukprot:5830856-Pyramimonas_sp.AAC.1